MSCSPCFSESLYSPYEYKPAVIACFICYRVSPAGNPAVQTPAAPQSAWNHVPPPPPAQKEEPKTDPFAENKGKEPLVDPFADNKKEESLTDPFADHEKKEVSLADPFAEKKELRDPFVNKEEKKDAPMADPFAEKKDASMADPFAEKKDASMADPFAEKKDESLTDPFANTKKDASMADPFAEKKDESLTDPFANTKKDASMADPFAEKKDEPMVDPFAEKKDEPMADPFAEKKDASMADPFAEKKDEPMADPFAEKKDESMADPFANTKKDESLTDPFAEKKDEPMVDPFANTKKDEPMADPFANTKKDEPPANPSEMDQSRQREMDMVFNSSQPLAKRPSQTLEEIEKLKTQKDQLNPFASLTPKSDDPFGEASPSNGDLFEGMSIQESPQLESVEKELQTPESPKEMVPPSMLFNPVHSPRSQPQSRPSSPRLERLRPADLIPSKTPEDLRKAAEAIGIDMTIPETPASHPKAVRAIDVVEYFAEDDDFASTEEDGRRLRILFDNMLPVVAENPVIPEPEEMAEQVMCKSRALLTQLETMKVSWMQQQKKKKLIRQVNTVLNERCYSTIGYDIKVCEK